MSLLCVPHGSPAVKAYRFLAPKVDRVVPGMEAGPELINWLTEHGMEWDGYWSAGFNREASAMAEVMRHHEIPVIVDVDDHFEEVPTGNAAHVHWVHAKKKMLGQLLKDADRRVASTPWLGERHDAKVAPNFVDPQDWDWSQRERKSGETVLLHCGSVNRAEDFLQKEEPLREFLELPNTKVVFMGWMPKWARDYEAGRVVFCRWVEYHDARWGPKYNRMLRWINPDILISPLEHNDFNLAKSNIKWLESAMIGAAFVGERWGELERTVEDGVTGLLAAGQDEWTDRLKMLVEDKDLRGRLAEQARGVVESKWTWGAVEQDWRAALGV